MNGRCAAVGLLLAASLVLLLACGDDGESAAPTATTVVEATPTAPADATPAATPFQGGRDPVEQPAGDVPATPLLVNVEVSEQDRFDRVVFVFEGVLPGYRVEYVDEAVDCGTGEPVAIAGAALLQVRMTPAAAHDEAGAPTIQPLELMPGLPSVLEAELTCDFEADVTWVIGLAQASDFRVEGVARERTVVVVDIAHP